MAKKMTKKAFYTKYGKKPPYSIDPKKYGKRAMWFVNWNRYFGGK